MLDQQTRQHLITQYEEGYRVVTEALAGATDAEMEAREGPMEWCPREVCHHLGDSEMSAAFRLRHLLAGNRPTLQGYDQEEFARKLFYDRPVDASLAAFKAARDSTAELLHRLTPEHWTLEGTHTESGRYSVDDWLQTYGPHAHDHADQIRRARATVRSSP